MRQYGLIGKVLSHSFSKKYFDNKFKTLGDKNCNYDLFELKSIEDIHTLLANDSLCGFNVTIPYKQSILQYIDEVSAEALQVGAVNVVKIERSKAGIPFLKGYNTDIYGFKYSLLPLLKTNHRRALIFGTGGASKAVAYVLKSLNIDYKFVSRTQTGENILAYSDINDKLLSECNLLINTTPAGMYPNITESPFIDFKLLTPQHLCYDLIYNPEKTLFLQQSEIYGATIKNGYDMLVLQAEKSWTIWNEKEDL